MAKAALIVGAGDGISASFARLLAREGMKVALAARNTDKLAALIDEIGGVALRCEVTAAEQVERLFAEVDDRLGALDVVHYNPSYRTQGALVELDPAEVRQALMVSAFGGFLVAQQAARRMLREGGGAILFTGASASVKGYARSAPFAMGKFALRGLAQSMARELAPQNIHVAHFVIDGGVRSARRREPSGQPDSMLDPDAIAETYLAILKQPRSAWTWEVELRPWVETF
jgi:NAD(P)-dependent dehydrogenase (short-subunit alcohol dehydrogenase family)